MSLHLPETSINPSKWSASNPWKQANHTPGAFPSSPQPEHELAMTEPPSMAQAMRDRRQDYIRKKNIKIKIGTWNVAAVGDTYKDLPSWFLKNLGIRGLHQDLSGLSLAEDGSRHEHIESVAEQEARSGRKQATVPKGEVAAVSDDGDIGLYVLGLQELVDNSSLTEAMRPYYDSNTAKKWLQAIKDCLPHGYIKVAEQQLLGLLILVYAAPQVAPQVTSVDCQSVGTGALGYVGNKGAVSVRLVLGGTTRMLFVNSHLAAGADQTSLNRRLWDTNQILSRTKFSPAIVDGDQGSGQSESINDEDFAFWFGDLNFRLDDIPGEDVRRLLLLHTRNEYDVMNKSRMRIDSELGYINADVSNTSSSTDTEDPNSKAGKPAKESSAEPELDPKEDPASLITTINSLLQHDQLRAQQRHGKAFHEGWREGEINFLPTYKYDIGSVGMFDSGEKKRSPSWCDRILYRTRQDRVIYEERVKLELDSRKRDEDMKARGIDTDSAEQDVLFDYDPESDGADAYDEYDEGHDQPDSHSATTEHGSEDEITIESYVAHQRVLSSDHKPLSAVFSLTYDAVIPELKAQVQQDVARMLDKNENDTRPNVTVVIDNPVEGNTHTDRPTGASELNSVEFDEVRYHMPKTQTLTIANTGPISATFAFVNRPVPDEQEQGPFPSWMDIKVHHEPEPAMKANDDLGLSTRFVLSPGDIATVDLTIDVDKKELVHALNEGKAEIDEILVLRVLNGRDHFISVRGTWCPSSFHRHLDQLVRFPKGVRSVPIIATENKDEPRPGSATAYHSAPKELFELTEALPGLVERAVADWTMTNHNVTPPWDCDSAWPFRGHLWEEEVTRHAEQLADLREALDTATPLAEHLSEQLSPLARVELLAETLLSFLQSLQDGIIPASTWHHIESQLAAIETSKTSGDHLDLQEILMDALSTTPVHSVSLTFITFMLTRIITELCSNEGEIEQALVSSPQSRRGRSSTEASEATSEFSTMSAESTSTRSSFLPSLSRRKTGSKSNPSSPIVAKTPADRRKRCIDSYSEFWADVIIRSDRDLQVKGKEKKALDARKRRVIATLLDSPSM